MTVKTGEKHTLTLREKANRVLSILDANSSDVKCALNFSTPLELLVASILSAQCTDERVNEITKILFHKYPDAQSYANADLETLETDIYSTGFYRNKARALIGSTTEIVKKHGGAVPDTMDKLVTLPGIGRKTANLVLVCAFNMPGIIVDTHVFRVSLRLGLTDKKNADKIELDLRGIIPEDKWSRFSLFLINHGREICTAKKPLCDSCLIYKLCEYPTLDQPKA